jgi:predicted O-methyltransferase YrrM
MSTMRPTSDTYPEWFDELRAEWFRRMRPFGTWVPWELRERVHLEEVEEDPSFWGEQLFSSAPQLAELHLKRCVVVPHRSALLQRLPTGGVVAEVGTLHGEFSREILDIVRPRELHLIDREITTAVGDLAASPAFNRQVRVHQGDSVQALESFPDEYFDWIYVDARHDYEGVRRDAEVARRKVRRDGLLIFNDYILWSYVEMEPYGVVQTVNELCTEDGWEIVFLALPSHLYCDVAVKQIAW